MKFTKKLSDIMNERFGHDTLLSVATVDEHVIIGTSE